jgi:TadE-like protein
MPAASGRQGRIRWTRFRDRRVRVRVRAGVGVGVGPRGGHARSERVSRGSVTAEFALLLPSLVLLIGLLVGAAAAGVAQVRCIDAARSAARLAARHESTGAVLEAARSAGPSGAVVRVSGGGPASGGAGLVRVVVSARVSLPLPGRPGLSVSASSTARLEETG